MAQKNSKAISICISLIIAQIMCAGFLLKNIQLIINPTSIVAKWLAGISFILFSFLFIVSLWATIKHFKREDALDHHT
ncbi:hypothetical protein MKY07_15575 [Solibacillus sp. FSL W7-1472]|uniref:hypothetical protein n=1 Tax=Solibacillus sp. FSL W7-1472 TaxID=2921707 RepID=UPI0030DD649F